MNPDLLRQRRNLIAISAFLILFDIANVQVAKLSLLGNELIVGNARALIYSAWVLWAYFLLRYYQYWRAEPEQHIRDSYIKHFTALALAYVGTQAIQNSLRCDIGHADIKRAGFLNWSYTLNHYNPEQLTVVHDSITRFPVRCILSWQLKSALHVLFHTTHATDRILPFISALAAPIVVFTTKCPAPWPWIWDMALGHLCT